MKPLLGSVFVALIAPPVSSEEARRLSLSLGYDDLRQYRKASPAVAAEYDFRPIDTSGHRA
ncbi:MAG: hypothetical protein HKP37_12910 [Boseongicola sp.]|nr:hypothetical protein [Boseongicola sp.]